MNLADVARQYRAESLRPAGHRRQQERDEAARNANFLDQCVANRTPDDHHACHDTPTWLTIDWARRHGYQVAPTPVGGGALALAFQRDTETVIANLPFRLHWDGRRIVVTTA
ncbi:hypothetical protein [Streptomyces hydrogenans]|uniref:hypothetical protein n=1 Tax=Streptomyces hydrogenans TaxID=1873719 RepID=UPI0038251D67